MAPLKQAKKLIQPQHDLRRRKPERCSRLASPQSSVSVFYRSAEHLHQVRLASNPRHEKCRNNCVTKVIESPEETPKLGFPQSSLFASQQLSRKGSHFQPKHKPACPLRNQRTLQSHLPPETKLLYVVVADNTNNITILILQDAGLGRSRDAQGHGGAEPGLECLSGCSLWLEL